ncbi:MAG: hypothetical protein GY714_31940 [Desulfobacterales bacterium]|nr:hypothetical protein [Desulfobacterales bacterium]
MRTKIFILVAMLSLLISCGSKDVKVTDVKNKAGLIEDVYIKSGLSKQVPTFKKQIDEGLKVYEGRVPPELLKIVKYELNKIYDYVTLEKRIKENINSNINEDILRHMIKWYSSDLGTKITNLEVSQSDPKEIFSFIRQNQKTKFPEKRVILLKRLDTAMNSVELATDLSIYGGLNVADKFNNLNLNTKPFEKEQLKQYMSKQRSKIRASVEKLVNLSSLFSYKNLSDEELLKYVEFLELPKSKIFVDVVMRALLRSIYTKADLTI